MTEHSSNEICLGIVTEKEWGLLKIALMGFEAVIQLILWP
jgi:hypothetical protein